MSLASQGHPLECPGTRRSGESHKTRRLSPLLQDAVTAVRSLKRKYRLLFQSDPKDFRRQLKKAEGRVLNLKRGPKPDPAISSAAREVAAGMRIEEAFQKRFPSLKTSGNESLYAMALDSFRSKVNAYIRRHSQLKRQRDRRKARTNAPNNSA